MLNVYIRKLGKTSQNKQCQAFDVMLKNGNPFLQLIAGRVKKEYHFLSIPTNIQSFLFYEPLSEVLKI